jgi:RimJ/RimL family protein N-acetyltransferase
MRMPRAGGSIWPAMLKLDAGTLFPPQRTIDTGRLIIRRFRESDFASYAEFHQDSGVYRYLYQTTPSGDALRRNFLEAAACRFASDGDAASLAVVRKFDEALVGEVILKLASRSALQGEVGYIFNPRFGGHGFATEAVGVMLDIGFDDIGFHRIFARLDPGNRGSVGVVERLRLRREAHLLQNDRFGDIWGDEYVYAILAEEWRSRRDRSASIKGGQGFA